MHVLAPSRMFSHGVSESAGGDEPEPVGGGDLPVLVHGGALVLETELGGDSAETDLDVDGGHSEAAGIVGGGGHSTNVEVAKLGVVEGELLVATRKGPGLS